MMLTITDADLALAAKLGLSLKREAETDQDRAAAADPRAIRAPESWQVQDKNKFTIGRIHFTPVDCLYATKYSAGITGQEETVADALRRIAPVIRHVRTGEDNGTETVTIAGKTFTRPIAVTTCGAPPTGADYNPTAAKVELRNGVAREMCPACRAKLEATTPARDLSHLSDRRGSSTAKQRDFIRRLLDEAARSGRPYLMDARDIDKLSNREASAKIDDLKTQKAKGWRAS